MKNQRSVTHCIAQRILSFAGIAGLGLRARRHPIAGAQVAVEHGNLGARGQARRRHGGDAESAAVPTGRRRPSGGGRETGSAAQPAAPEPNAGRR